ncbi:hypothetical protein F9U64_19080 [Gracilibacillus oryzae]|uniref:Uncharacterized protein n=1 Tax=Gracilibacillus oryzae TaxID=1672701 RepID=A0A7C8KMY7_9BACI|nr:hypothetical protein [Gracilibacillus oryzae]KAB8126923.1 hypothetical protein F9U64_19080 [Gracilibacillus oryzae]
MNRLEEIKDKLTRKYPVRKSKKLLDHDDVRYLIRQAENAETWKEQIKVTQNRNERLEQQNNQYREFAHTIRLILESPFTDFDDLHNEIKKHLEALEENE